MPITAKIQRKSFLVVGKIQSELIGTNLPKLFQQKPLQTPDQIKPDLTHQPTWSSNPPSWPAGTWLTPHDTSIGIGKFWHCFHFSLYFLFSSCGPWQPFLITPLSPGKATLFSIIGKRPNQAEKFSDTDFLTRSIHEDKTFLLSLFVFWTFDCIFVLKPDNHFTISKLKVFLREKKITSGREVRGDNPKSLDLAPKLPRST